MKCDKHNAIINRNNRRRIISIKNRQKEFPVRKFLLPVVFWLWNVKYCQLAFTGKHLIKVSFQQVEWLLQGLEIEQKKAHHQVKINHENSYFSYTEQIKRPVDI